MTEPHVLSVDGGPREGAGLDRPRGQRRGDERGDVGVAGPGERPPVTDLAAADRGDGVVEPRVAHVGDAALGDEVTEPGGGVDDLADLAPPRTCTPAARSRCGMSDAIGP